MLTKYCKLMSNKRLWTREINLKSNNKTRVIASLLISLQIVCASISCEKNDNHANNSTENLHSINLDSSKPVEAATSHLRSSRLSPYNLTHSDQIPQDETLLPNKNSEARQISLQTIDEPNSEKIQELLEGLQLASTSFPKLPGLFNDQNDLITSSTSQNRQQMILSSYDPSYGAISAQSGEAGSYEAAGPSLAELTAAGTAAGLMLNDLATQAHVDEGQDRDDYEGDDESERGRANNENLPALQTPYRQQQQQVPEPQSSSNQGEVSPELAPDSMESLMRSEGEDFDQTSGANEPSASGQVQEETRPESDNSVESSTSGDESDEDIQPSNVQFGPLTTSQFLLDKDGQPLISNEQLIQHQLLGPLSDLNTAAGHHYGKMKKKKIKKIVIKKKKKKYKKVKKVIVIKKKKKKMKKKKKKPMKKHHHHDHGKYYMYAKVPKKKSWEFGFKKGNKKHWIERHEKGHKNKFKTKVKWYDKKSKGKGFHVWDYNHHDKKKKKHY